MHKLMLTFAMASALLLAGCSTSSVVHKGYKAAAPETFWYELKGNADTDEAALAQLRAQLDAQLAEARLAGGRNVAGSRRVEIAITHYYLRGNATRILAGIMAGRDKVKSAVQVKGDDGETLASFDIESTNATAWGTSGGLIGRHADEIVSRLKELQ